MTHPRVLFILKQRQHGAYGTWSYSAEGKNLPSGLSVSAGQMSCALVEAGIESHLVQVVDNNCIDREVTKYKPTHVFIEAFWVVPEKFAVLKKLHPNVTWIVRNHSKTDFLGHEGAMIGWAIDYIRAGVILACNSVEATEDFKSLAHTAAAPSSTVVYLPNYYVAPEPNTTGWDRFAHTARRRMGMSKGHDRGDELKVGCFGAIRPLKNNLHQALAAIRVADKLGKKLKFYINATRIEGKADSLLNSLRALFKRFSQHTLVEIEWMSHDEFTKLVKTMDLVLQVSNSETFNIVAADAVSQGVPVLVSNEIPWLDCDYHANPNDVGDIARMIMETLKYDCDELRDVQLCQLRQYVAESKRIWLEFLHAK